MNPSPASRDTAAALRAPVCHLCREVGRDGGYEDAVAEFDLGVAVAPDVAVDARTPGEVAAPVDAVAPRRARANLVNFPGRANAADETAEVSP